MTCYLIKHRRVNWIYEFREDRNDMFRKHQGTQNSVASHAIVFMVCGVASRLNFVLGYFATRTATSGMLFPLLWRAIGCCESYAGLKVIFVVSDKASSNQKLYQIHQISLRSVAYKTTNVFSREQCHPLLFQISHIYLKLHETTLQTQDSTKRG